MARRFVRIDIHSPVARDFRPLAVEPGVGMLDASGGNARILFRWLGRFVAFPEWEGESVNFLVQDDQGGRLEDVYCQPATRDDLNESLAAEMQAVRERLQRIQPNSPSEQTLLKVLVRSFRELTEDPLRTDLDCYFFRYRDAQGAWRLVWCWGYQRTDEEAAPAVVCTDPDCNLLFVRRPGRKNKCPACQAALLAAPKQPSHWKRNTLLVLLLLLLVAGVGSWWWERTHLFFGPQRLQLVLGQVADFKVPGPSEEPVTMESADAALVEVTPLNRLIGRAVGQTSVSVARGQRTGEIRVTVADRELFGLAINPDKVSLPAGDKLALRVFGTIAGDRQVELAPDVVQADRLPLARYAQFNRKTLEVAGVAPTETKPQSLSLRCDAQQATASIDVTVPVADLEIMPAGPLDLPLGQFTQLQLWATYRDGRREQVPPERAQWKTDPSADKLKGFTVQAGRVVTLDAKAGQVNVSAEWYGETKKPVAIRATDRADVKLQAQATPSNPTVGEGGSISAQGKTAQADAPLAAELLEFKSSDAKRLSIDAKTGAFRAEAPGDASVTVTHPGAAQAAEAKLAIAPPVTKPREGAPVAVKVLSDQGPAVSFPVGAEFTDFRVEAEYKSGLTRFVTRRATIRTTQPPEQAPLTPSGGRLLGIRVGDTVVQAEFDGVHSQQGLNVKITGQVDADEIRIAPTPATLLPGESLALDAIGYKAGKQIGSLSGLSSLKWKDEGDAIQVGGARVTAVKLGSGTVTAQLGGIASKPGTVNVVASIADPLKLDPKTWQMRVGESRRVGAEVQVSRGELDVSSLCRVTSSQPDVLRYDPQTRSLTALRPGTAAVSFTAGDKLAQAMVEVEAGGVIRGEVLVEPAGGRLVPGQALPLRALVVTSDGQRIDRTSSAVFTSSEPAKVAIIGNAACALAAGTATITASVAGAEKTGLGQVTVLDAPITELVIDPAQLRLSTGDVASLRILGRAEPGTHELFPQRDLTLSVGGPKPDAIRIVGSADVRGQNPGAAEVNVHFRNSLSARVPVSVAADAISDLRIEPAAAAIMPGDQIAYQVTGMKGGTLRVLGPDDGVRLATANPAVADVAGGLNVEGRSEGRTDVIARVDGREAAASLTVSTTDPLAVEYRRRRGQRHYTRIDDREVIIQPGYETVVRTGAAVDLRFVPDAIRMAPDLPGVGVRVYEVLSDRTLGRDVTSDPQLEISPPTEVARLERTPDGPVFRPVAPGTTRVAARLGTLTTEAPLLLQVGDVPDALRVEAAPDRLWIEPAEVALERQQISPPFRVMAATGSEPPQQVTTQLESLDRNVLVPDPAQADRFVALGYGGTQVRASYRGKEAFSNVSVTGTRFMNVVTSLVEGSSDFTVTIEVQAAKEEGPLEYRVYLPTQTPPAAWTAAQGADGYQRVQLHSPALPYGDRTARYSLMIEARDAAGRSVQKYPFTFRLAPQIQRTDGTR